MYNIILPIISNLIVLMILTASIIVGKKNGFVLQLTKLILIVDALIGSYYLAPYLTTILVENTIITDILIKIGLPNFELNYITHLMIFGVIYAIISLFTTIIRIKIRKQPYQINTAKRKRIKSLDRRADKNLRREEKRLKRLNFNEKSITKKSKIAGVILGVLTAIVILYALAIPTKYIINEVTIKNPEFTDVKSFYEYSICGQIDNIIDLPTIIKY